MLQKVDPVRNYISKGIDKKSLLYLGIVIIAFLVAIGLIWYFFRVPKIPETLVPEKPSKEKIIEQQLKELEQLRKETPTLTEKEIQSQLKELEKLRSKTKPLSQEEIQKQLEELEKLRKE